MRPQPTITPPPAVAPRGRTAAPTSGTRGTRSRSTATPRAESHRRGLSTLSRHAQQSTESARERAASASRPRPALWLERLPSSVRGEWSEGRAATTPGASTRIAVHAGGHEPRVERPPHRIGVDARRTRGCASALGRHSGRLRREIVSFKTGPPSNGCERRRRLAGRGKRRDIVLVELGRQGCRLEEVLRAPGHGDREREEAPAPEFRSFIRGQAEPASSSRLYH